MNIYNKSLSIFLSLLILMFIGVGVSYADPAIYSPGQTLLPTCAPGSAPGGIPCTVNTIGFNNSGNLDASSTVGSGLTAGIQINDNLFGYGVKGIGAVYNDTNTGELGTIVAGDFTGFGQPVDTALFGVTNPPNFNQSAQLISSWDGTDANNRISAANHTHSYSIEVTTKSGTKQGVSFQMDNTGYTFPVNNVTGGILTNDGSGALSWETPKLKGASIDPTAPSTGDILFYNGSSWVSLHAGTPGQVLTVGGDGNPTWQ